MLKHVNHRVPVTALAFNGDETLLAGEGNHLRAYDVTTRTLLASAPAFKAQAVHGIIVSNTTSLKVVWGGTLLRTVDYEPKADNGRQLRLGPLCDLTDWTLDAAFSPDGTLIAAVSAHNALTVVKTDTLHTEAITPAPAVPGSNCLLYSAHVTWLSASQCLIASGTAFGDVIVWSSRVSQDGGKLSADSQTHYTFSAHEGSVFGVRISDLELGRGRRLLATCSDDRTIAIWDLSDLTGTIVPSTIRERDTGFGPKIGGDALPPPCLAKVMGHISRIWHVRFVHCEGGHLPQTVSFGEDASNVAWNLKPAEPSSIYGLPYILQQSSVQTAHAGKNIWSIAMGSNGLIATGGADGAIAIRSTPQQHEGVEVTLDGLLEPRDFLRASTFVDDNTIVCTTDQGKAVLVTLRPDRTISHRQLSPVMQSLKGHSVIASVRGMAFTAGRGHSVYMYDQAEYRFSELFNADHERVASGVKTSALFCHTEKGLANISLLVATVGASTCQVHQVGSPVTKPVVKSTWTLKLPAGFVITSFTQTSEHQRKLVLLGSRNDSIAIFELPPDDTDGIVDTHCIIGNAHGNDAVTSLALRASHPDSVGDFSFLHSAGRDGMHSIHRIHGLATGEVKIEHVHQLRLPFGPNIEGLGFDAKQRLRIWGFRSKHFVMYDVTDQREIMTVDCGGAHRQWAYHPQSEGGTFVWTKAARMYHQTQTELPYQLINSGGHGREVKAVAVSPGLPQIIATGAEDTDIKLWVLNEHGELRCLQTLRKHNTGIQHLQWSTDGRLLFSSAGCEEFMVWKVSHGIPGVSIGVVCASAHPRSGASDLRITGFQATSTRFGDGQHMTSLEIVMAYSDSTLKSWLYEDETWTLLASGDYLTSCLTHVSLLGEGDSNHVTAATDGHLAFWPRETAADARVRWARRHKVHQNAILSVVTHRVSDDAMLIFTGGDDNALGITLITADNECTLVVPSAHAAAITGLAVLATQDQRLWLVSASLDQRLKVWRLDVDLGQPGVAGIEVELWQNVFTAVADASSLATCESGNGGSGLLVCGVGIEIWGFQDPREETLRL